jgi:hypothetical protein
MQSFSELAATATQAIEVLTPQKTKVKDTLKT